MAGDFAVIVRQALRSPERGNRRLNRRILELLGEPLAEFRLRPDDERAVIVRRIGQQLERHLRADRNRRQAARLDTARILPGATMIR